MPQNSYWDRSHSMFKNVGWLANPIVAFPKKLAGGMLGVLWVIDQRGVHML